MNFCNETVKIFRQQYVTSSPQPPFLSLTNSPRLELPRHPGLAAEPRDLLEPHLRSSGRPPFLTGTDVFFNRIVYDKLGEPTVTWDLEPPSKSGPHVAQIYYGTHPPSFPLLTKTLLQYLPISLFHRVRSSWFGVLVPFSAGKTEFCCRNWQIGLGTTFWSYLQRNR